MSRTAAPTPQHDVPEREFPHWNRVYAGVLVFTVIVIISLSLFSRYFTP